MNIEQFIRKYEPIRSNGKIVQYDCKTDHEWNEIVKAHKEKKVCTVVENEGIMILLSGIHYANTMFYIITKHALEEEINFEY